MLYKSTIINPYQDAESSLENNQLVTMISHGARTNWRGNILVFKCRPGLHFIDVDTRDVRLIERMVLRYIIAKG